MINLLNTYKNSTQYLRQQYLKKGDILHGMNVYSKTKQRC